MGPQTEAFVSAVLSTQTTNVPAVLGPVVAVTVVPVAFTSRLVAGTLLMVTVLVP
jgi:hypothetical protein